MTQPFVPADPEPASVPFLGPDIAPDASTPPPGPVPTWPVQPARERRGARLGTVLVASILSAALASGGTVALVRGLQSGEAAAASPDRWVPPPRPVP